MNLIAEWIAPTGVENARNCHFYANKSFELIHRPELAELRIACESSYLLKLNGYIVGRGPARGTHTVNFFDKYDITALLRDGANQVDVLVCCMNVACGGSAPAVPALWLDIPGICATGDDWQTAIADQEFDSNAPIYSMQLGCSEWRDMNYEFEPRPAKTMVLPSDSPVRSKKLLPRETPLPYETVYLAGDVPVVALVPAADLNDRAIAKLSTSEPHFPAPQEEKEGVYQLTLGGSHAIRIAVPPDGNGVTMVFNFTREISGRFELDISASSGTVVDLVCEEELYLGDRLRADHSHTNPTYQYCDRYILRDGRQNTGHLFAERGFRMVQVTLRNISAPVTLHAVRGIDRRYPFGHRSSFFCSDYQLNRLWEVARETLSACITDVFTDCPWRERLFFINDFVVENRIALQLFGDGRLHRHAFQMIFSEASPNELLPVVLPSTRDMFECYGFPPGYEWLLSSNLTLPLELLDYWMYTGDAETVQEHYPKLKKIIDLFRSQIDKNGVIVPPAGGNFFDWSFELNGMEFSGVQTALLNYLYIMALQSMDRLAVPAGETPYLQAEIATLLEQTFRAFYHPDRKLLLDCRAGEGDADKTLLKLLGVPPTLSSSVKISRTTHALAILAGAGKGPDEAFCQALGDDSLLTPELFYSFFVIAAMIRSKSYDSALAYILKYWKRVLDSGSPTVWENGVHSPGKNGFGGSASLCHGFGSGPVDFLQTVTLGITPILPGFTEFSFMPHPCGLTFARGIVPTPHGAIRVEWECKGNELHATLTVPENCTAVTPVGNFATGTHQMKWSTDKNEIHNR